MALIVVLVVLLPSLLMAAARSLSRRRAGRPAPPAVAAGSQVGVTEATALRLLLAGAVSRDEYRRSIETLAAYDELVRPVQVPSP